MEKAYGIEAARAKLGEIADHIRETGQIISLTRHGRTVAVVGPVESVRPAQGVPVSLHFPHIDWTVNLPAVPRIGESFEWTDPDDGGGLWKVTDVVHGASPSEAEVGITLDPLDDDARNQATEK